MKFILNFFLLLVIYSSSAQPITGVWRGKFINGSGLMASTMKVEMKLVKKGDSLVGTAYYYVNTNTYLRYSVRGYFNVKENTVHWTDDKFLRVKPVGKTTVGVFKDAMVADADFNCPGNNIMKLDGKSHIGSDGPEFTLHFDKVEKPLFKDEWDNVIEGYFTGMDNPQIIDSVYAITKPLEPPANTEVAKNETPVTPTQQTVTNPVEKNVSIQGANPAVESTAVSVPVVKEAVPAATNDVKTVSTNTGKAAVVAENSSTQKKESAIIASSGKPGNQDTMAKANVAVTAEMKKPEPSATAGPAAKQTIDKPVAVAVAVGKLEQPPVNTVAKQTAGTDQKSAEQNQVTTPVVNAAPVATMPVNKTGEQSQPNTVAKQTTGVGEKSVEQKQVTTPVVNAAPVATVPVNKTGEQPQPNTVAKQTTGIGGKSAEQKQVTTPVVNAAPVATVPVNKTGEQPQPNTVAKQTTGIGEKSAEQMQVTAPAVNTAPVATVPVNKTGEQPQPNTVAKQTTGVDGKSVEQKQVTTPAVNAAPVATVPLNKTGEQPQSNTVAKQTTGVDQKLVEQKQVTTPSVNAAPVATVPVNKTGEQPQSNTVAKLTTGVEQKPVAGTTPNKSAVATLPVVKKEEQPQANTVAKQTTTAGTTVIKAPVTAAPVVRKDEQQVATSSVAKQTTSVNQKPVEQKQVAPTAANKIPVENSTAKTVNGQATGAAIAVAGKKPEVKQPDPVIPKVDPLAEQMFITRKKINQAEIPVTGDSVELNFYDNAEVDGDSISLFLNGTLLFNHVMLTAQAYTFKIAASDLTDGSELTMVAENLGTIPPNTAFMMAVVDGKRYTARIESTEQTSGVIRLVKKRR